MSELNFSIKSSRRSSNSSKVTSCYSENELNVLSFYRSNWYEAYTYFKNNDQILLEDHQILMEILKLLFDEALSKEIIIHLLSLIENCSYMFEDPDFLEQILGSIINVYLTLSLSEELKVKYLYTITNLLVSNLELVKSNQQLTQIATKFIDSLINNLKNDYLVQSSTECLIQFEGFITDNLNLFLEEVHLNNNNVILLALLLKSNKLGLENITELTEYMTNDKYNFVSYCRILMFIYSYIRINQKQSFLSINFFKPFLNELIYSKELSLFHLALELLKNFDLAFSSYGEQNLINQLFTVCIHPSLITSHRLMMLDFAENFVRIPKVKNYLNLKIFEICNVLDGPDTQEKKLKILIQTNIEDELLLNNLKPLKSMCLYKKNDRASNSLYRVLNSIIKNRSSMTNKIEYLVLSMILQSPSKHIPRTISLLNLNPQLTENLLKLIIEETNNHFDNFQNENDLKQYFLAFEWILNKTVLDENNNLIILNFVLRKSENRQNLFNGLLACCAAVIKKQILTDKIKNILKDSLNYLSLKGKNDVELVSWAQIYLIAIETLPNQENFIKVFADLESSKQNNIHQVLDPDECPIKFERIKCPSNIINNYNDFKCPFLINFNLSIKDEFVEKFPILFSLEILVKLDNQNIEDKKFLTLLKNDEKAEIIFELNAQLAEHIDLKISSQFTDLNGKVYYHYGTKIEIEFIDLFQPLCLNLKDFNEIWKKFLNSNGEKIFKKVISLPKLENISQFFKKFQWVSEFAILPNRISILIPSSNIALIKVLELNGNVNLRIMANNFYIIQKLNQKFTL